MTDEVLIERIRDAMHAEVEGLQAPAEVVQGVLAVRPGRRLGLSWLTPALAVAVAAIVAVVAVTSLGHRAPASRGTLSPVPVAARRLVSRLAVLRRPQRRPDVLPGWAVQQTESLSHQAKLIAGLSRLVGSVHLGQYGNARVYLVVETPPRFPVHRKRPGAPLLNPRLGDVASIAYVGPFREEAAINGPTVAAGGDQVAATARGLTADPGQVSDLWGAVASIVPDGVTRVKWVFTRLGTASGLPPITLWPRVRGNVAIGRLAPTLQAYLSSAVWYDPDGRVRESFGSSTGASASVRKFKQALETSGHQPVAPVLIRHFRVLRTASGHSRAPGLSDAAVASLIEPNPVDLNIYTARFVAYAGTPAKLFVIPGSQGMALRSNGPLVGQATGGLTTALSGSLFIEGAGLSGHRTIDGLAPDGNSAVSVLLPGGGVRTARVLDNVYSITVPADARSVVLQNASGRIVRFRL